MRGPGARAECAGGRGTARAEAGGGDEPGVFVGQQDGGGGGPEQCEQTE